MWRSARLALLVAVIGGTGGCANQGAPPGGPEDRRPPVIIRTDPEPFAVVEDLTRPIRFYFDERISEGGAGGALQEAVTVSPSRGEVDVGHDSRSLSVRVAGGLQPGVVYRVTVLPQVSDLFGNAMRDPFELVFSTGPEPTPTTLAGEVWDRVTGRGVNGALVRAVGPDSMVHVARTDEQGIFALRYLPAGEFLVTGFDDVDRDREVDAREVKGSLVTTVEPGDTVLVDVPILPPDTTTAVLGRASALDSTTMVLEFDDYLDPGADVSGVTVDLRREGGDAPEVARLFGEPAYSEYVTRVTDSISAATPEPAPAAQPDSAAAPPDTVQAGAPADTAVVPGPPGPAAAPAGRVGPTPLPGGRGAAPRGAAASGGVPPGRVLPGRRLVAQLTEPLEVGVEYTVEVGSVVNLNGLPGGGGEATFVREAPPPEPAAPDSVPGGADADAAPDTVPPTGDVPPPGGGPPPGDTVPPGAPLPGGRR